MVRPRGSCISCFFENTKDMAVCLVNQEACPEELLQRGSHVYVPSLPCRDSHEDLEVC